MFVWTCCNCGNGCQLADISSVCAACGHTSAGCCLTEEVRDSDTGTRTGSGDTSGDYRYRNDRSHSAAEDPSQSLKNLQDPDFSAICDPGSHFSNLEVLEVKVVTNCGIRTYPIDNGHVDATMSQEGCGIDDCIRHLTGILDAYILLQENGFCTSHYSVLVQDENRQGVAVACPISRAVLETVLQIAHEAKGSSAIKCLEDFDIQEEILNLLVLVSQRGMVEYSKDISTSFKFIIPLLAIGLSSYSGSHANRFDLTAYQSDVQCFKLQGGFCFRQRSLACLAQYIGGPVWILERPGSSSSSYMVSITISDFADLWGPVHVVEDEAGLVDCIFTERGLITHKSTENTSQVAKSDEVPCHWNNVSPQAAHAVPIDASNQSFDSSSPTDRLGSISWGQKSSSVAEKSTTKSIASSQKLLIGMPNKSLQLGLSCRDSCRVQADCISQIDRIDLQFPGVSRSQFQLHQVGISLGAGQFVTPGAQMIWKRLPARRLKEMIMFHCQHNTSALSRLLHLHVGLEISICTGNSRRITLWDALKLYHMPNSTETCSHSPGDVKCLRECWSLSTDSTLSTNSLSQENEVFQLYEPVLRNSVYDLSMAGVDKDGYLQAWWPYTKAMHTNRIGTTSTDGTSNGWVSMLKETREVATFAVMSRRCLGYRGVDLGAQERVSRLCGGLCSRLATDCPPKLESRTVLETAIKIHPEAVKTVDIESPLAFKTRLRLGDVGCLEVRNEDAVQLVELKDGFIATVSELAICASQLKWGFTHHELVDAEAATGKTVRVIVV